MDNGNKVEIIREYGTFRLIDSFERGQVSSSKRLYCCSGISKWVQRVQFWDGDNENEVLLDLFGTAEGTKVIRLSEKIFEEREIKLLAELFGLELRRNYQLDAAIPIGTEHRLASLALKNIKNNLFYCAVFHLDSGDSRKNATLFIHGIWKAWLPGFVSNKLTHPS